MFITPINKLNSIEDLKGNNLDLTKNEGGKVFRDVFEGAINQVKSTDEELAKNEYLLATGQIDDAHAVPIAAAKAQISVDLLVQLRNKAMESYNELMRINL